MYTKNTDVAGDAQSKLLYQDKNAASLAAFINAFVSPMQAIEDMFYDLLMNRSLANAVGAQLDGIGRIVGETRKGLSDDTYRIRLKVRILVNRSEGEPERLIKIFKLFASATDVFYNELYPCQIEMMSNGTLSDSDAAVLRTLLEQAALGGVKIAYLGQFDAVKPFQFDVGAGFGVSTDLTVGGKFAKHY